MEKICYITGAGFSAPLGYPVISNFYEKSKNLYQNDRDKYRHFEEIFSKIREIAIIGQYYKTNLFDIEEILSILEMRRTLINKGDEELFCSYITDVITAFTPKLRNEFIKLNSIPPNWPQTIFGTDRYIMEYGLFVIALMGCCIQAPLYGSSGGKGDFIRVFEDNSKNSIYSIVTVNYDLLIETYIDFIRKINYLQETNSIQQMEDNSISTNCLPIAKLHGCISKGTIVPPTWNKYFRTEIQAEWKLAYSMLTSANHIRILGYSLPQSDTYIKYLLKSSVIDSTNLKSIDVICMDNNGEVKNRYSEFINFPKFRFVNGDITN